MFLMVNIYLGDFTAMGELYISNIGIFVESIPAVWIVQSYGWQVWREGYFNVAESMRTALLRVDLQGVEAE